MITLLSLFPGKVKSEGKFRININYRSGRTDCFGINHYLISAVRLYSSLIYFVTAFEGKVSARLSSGIDGINISSDVSSWSIKNETVFEKPRKYTEEILGFLSYSKKSFEVIFFS